MFSICWKKEKIKNTDNQFHNTCEDCHVFEKTKQSHFENANQWPAQGHLQQLVICLFFYVKKVKVAQSCPAPWGPMDYTVHGILQSRILEWVAFPFSRGSLNSGLPTLQADSLPAEPQGKPKNTGVGRLSLLQRIFPTQDRTRICCIADGFFIN